MSGYTLNDLITIHLPLLSEYLLAFLAFKSALLLIFVQFVVEVSVITLNVNRGTLSGMKSCRIQYIALNSHQFTGSDGFQRPTVLL